MAEVLTWEEKVKKGLPLSPLEEVKRDAERITLKRIRDNEEEKVYQATKDEPVVEEPVEEVVETESVEESAEEESEEPVEEEVVEPAPTVNKKAGK